MKNFKLGSILMMGILAIATMNTASADVQHQDDVIISQSLCVGNDCNNGESFGFDTLRVKENNLRIHFEDTSSSASFPSNDWRLQANDSANGGGNYFAIVDVSGNKTPFRLDASAPSNSLRVTNSGNVGFGEDSPVVELHVTDGDSPTLRLEQDGSSGFTPQTYDIAANESNFFIRDVTNGSRLFFRAQPGAPANSMFIANDGDIGFGTNSPAADLHINSNDLNGLLISGNGVKLADLKSNDGGIVQYRMLTDSSDRRFVGLNGAGTVVESQIQFGNEQVVIAGSVISSPFATFTAAGLVTTGAGACAPGPCDGTFDPRVYEVESIEDHANYMWDNKYLWGVGATPEGQPINLTKKTTGILHELEKAHIYIERLHSRLSALEEKLAN
ncbi:MAG: hypothetical protein ACI8XV_000561 [Arenicella sp.]|jgi:hypothetical protein